MVPVRKRDGRGVARRGLAGYVFRRKDRGTSVLSKVLYRVLRGIDALYECSVLLDASMVAWRNGSFGEDTECLLKLNVMRIKSNILNKEMSKEEYHALWRQSAHEAVPYTDDFPEALLVLPELSDGSIGQGNATSVVFQFYLNGEESKLSVKDNGGGIRNERRLLQWAASKATSNIHRNGHGTKKCLTKWEPDYEKAQWSIRWRLPGKNLQTTTYPFTGYHPDAIQDDEGHDTETLMPSGCEVSIQFNASSILGDLVNNPEALSGALKEIIQTRYSEDTLTRTEFIIDISYPHKAERKSLYRNSKKEKWHSFRTCVLNAIKNGTVKRLHESKHDIEGGYYTIEIYYIEVDGKKQFALKKEFPKYGLKSMRSSRVHIALDGRVIEATPVYQLLDLDANHNDYNGYKAFVNFVPNTKDDYTKLPLPCTTKVSLYENDPVYRGFVATFKNIFIAVEKKKFKENNEKPRPPAVPAVIKKQPVVTEIVEAVPALTETAEAVPALTEVIEAVPALTEIVEPVPALIEAAEPVPALTEVIEAVPALIEAAETVSAEEPEVTIPQSIPATSLESTHAGTNILPRSFTPVGGHSRLVGCSMKNLYDTVICFRDKLNKLPLEGRRKSAAAKTQPGLAQKIDVLREILEILEA
jgi:hypothetical protein